MADEDETELPLWWVGDRQLRLRLGGSFARVLKRLDAHAVAAMQGTGDMLRRVTSGTEEGPPGPQLSAAERYERMVVAAVEGPWFLVGPSRGHAPRLQLDPQAHLQVTEKNGLRWFQGGGGPQRGVQGQGAVQHPQGAFGRRAT